MSLPQLWTGQAASGTALRAASAGGSPQCALVVGNELYAQHSAGCVAEVESAEIVADLLQRDSRSYTIVLEALAVTSASSSHRYSMPTAAMFSRRLLAELRGITLESRLEEMGELRIFSMAEGLQRQPVFKVPVPNHQVSV